MLPEVDLVIGAVLLPGAKAPRVVTRAQLGLMKPHAVLVDVSIDQGGCFETSHATTHSDPTYEVDGITHYCVANMPGAVPITSTFALTNATMPYVVRLADLGVHRALAADEGFLRGLNVAAGRVTYAPVAHDQGLEGVAPEEALAAVARRRLGSAAAWAGASVVAGLACVAPARSGYAPRADGATGKEGQRGPSGEHRGRRGGAPANGGRRGMSARDEQALEQILEALPRRGTATSPRGCPPAGTTSSATCRRASTSSSTATPGWRRSWRGSRGSSAARAG